MYRGGDGLLSSNPSPPGEEGEPPGASARFMGSKRENLFGEFSSQPSPPKEERETHRRSNRISPPRKHRAARPTIYEMAFNAG